MNSNTAIGALTQTPKFSWQAVSEQDQARDDKEMFSNEDKRVRVLPGMRLTVSLEGIFSDAQLGKALAGASSADQPTLIVLPDDCQIRQIVHSKSLPAIARFDSGDQMTIGEIVSTPEGKLALCIKILALTIDPDEFDASRAQAGVMTWSLNVYAFVDNFFSSLGIDPHRLGRTELPSSPTFDFQWRPLSDTDQARALEIADKALDTNGMRLLNRKGVGLQVSIGNIKTDREILDFLQLQDRDNPMTRIGLPLSIQDTSALTQVPIQALAVWSSGATRLIGEIRRVTNEHFGSHHILCVDHRGRLTDPDRHDRFVDGRCELTAAVFAVVANAAKNTVAGEDTDDCVPV